VARRPLCLFGQSDPSLADRVADLAGEDVSPVQELDGGQQLRVVDILLSLAVATAPKIDNSELYDVYCRWAQLRYLGAFEAHGAMGDRLGLSPIGAAVAANQRRVFSEELGIGFATWLSRHWRLPGTSDSGATRQLVDADLAWKFGVNGTHILPIGLRRPDYVIAQQNIDGSSTLAFLECKGTSNPNTALRQLAKASEQLASGRVDNVRPSGLAISTVMNDKVMKYLAIQRRWNDALEMPCPRPTKGPDADLDSEQQQEPVDRFTARAWEDEPPMPETGAPSVRLPEFGDLQEALASGEVAGAGGALGRATSATMVASWSALADLAGNEEAFVRWTYNSGRPSRASRQPRARTEFITTGRDIIRGVSSIVAVPGGRLEVVLGILDFVDDALTNGSSTAIIDAQRHAESLTTNTAISVLQADDQVTAYGEDGSALVIRGV
jgi:hypothetical protein